MVIVLVNDEMTGKKKVEFTDANANGAVVVGADAG